MTLLPDLPPRPRRTRPAPPGSLQAVLAAGRRRRRRAAASGGGAVAAAALAVALIALPGGPVRNDGLQYADPAGTPSESASATTPVPVPEPEPQPAPSRFPGGPDSPPAGGGKPLLTTGPAGDPAGPAADSGGPPRADGPNKRPPFAESPRQTDAPAYCTQGLGVICHSGYTGTGEAQSGEPYPMRLSFCVADDSRRTRLGFRSGQELELAIASNATGRNVYRFSDTVTYTQGEHERVVPGGRCLEWSVVWRTTATDGTLVPTGEYTAVLGLVNETENGRETTANQRRTITTEISVVNE